MEFKYDVTLSFAGEDRSYVDEVAKILKSKGVKVFYDKFEEADLWGKDLGIHFDTIYRKSAKYCIPFISQHYKKKIWTNYELRNVISRAIEQNEEYILPVRFDDTEIEGIRPTIGFLDLRTKTPSDLAELIFTKLGMDHEKPVSEIFQEERNDIVHIQIMNSFVQGPFGLESSGATIKVTYTNKIKDIYRYFYEPIFRLTIPFEGGADAFYLIREDSTQRFPVKLEYGEEASFDYPLNLRQLELWEKLDTECEMYAIGATTVGEKFDSNKRPVKEIIQALKLKLQ